LHIERAASLIAALSCISRESREIRISLSFSLPLFSEKNKKRLKKKSKAKISGFSRGGEARCYYSWKKF